MARKSTKAAPPALPAATGIVLAFYGIGLVGEIASAFTRSFPPLSTAEKVAKPRRTDL